VALPLYSHCLITEKNLTGGASYVAPAGYIFIVRDIDVVDNSALGENVFETWILSAATGANPFFDVWKSPPGGASHQWRGRQVGEEGDSLDVFVAAGLDVRISGYVLSLP